MGAEEAVTGLLETLLPGDSRFPSAHDTGMAGLLLQRLRQADATFPEQVLAALTASRPAPDCAPAWQEAANRMEAVEPKLFAEFRKYAYLTYYEQPGVVAAIRDLGWRYNDKPLPEGYPDEPFEPSRDAPQHERGRWLRTDQVRRVDLSGLDLDSVR